MIDILKRNKVIIAAVALIVILFAWYGFSSNPPGAALLTETPSAQAPGESDLVSTLLQLRTITLSGTIFSDPAFAALHDFGTEIIPEPVGRPNPFAPISFSIQAPSAPTQSTPKNNSTSRP